MATTTDDDPRDVTDPAPATGHGSGDRRQSWDEYFLSLASQTSTRATCSRRKVGAVIVRDRRIVSTDYNGGPSGVPHCDEGGCPRAATDTPRGAGGDDSFIAIDIDRNHGEVRGTGVARSRPGSGHGGSRTDQGGTRSHWGGRRGG